MVDLLFTEIMSHLSQAKQIYSQSIHLTHELVLSTQITRGRVDFNEESTMKSPCWHRVFNLWPSDPDLHSFKTLEPASTMRMVDHKGTQDAPRLRFQLQNYVLQMAKNYGHQQRVE